MKPCLADVNVLLALLFERHEHHKVAMRWFDRLASNEAGLCRFVQISLIRLLGNRHIMGADAMPASAAWRLVQDLMKDERVVFIPQEPPGLDTVFPGLLNSPVPTVQLVADAYLAAFAITGSLTMVTLDGGFRQFKGLDVDLLRH